MSEFQKSQAAIDNTIDIKGGLIMTAVTLAACIPCGWLFFQQIAKHFG